MFIWFLLAEHEDGEETESWNLTDQRTDLGLSEQEEIKEEKQKQRELQKGKHRIYI